MQSVSYEIEKFQEKGFMLVVSCAYPFDDPCQPLIRDTCELAMCRKISQFGHLHPSIEKDG